MNWEEDDIDEVVQRIMDTIDGIGDVSVQTDLLAKVLVGWGGSMEDPSSVIDLLFRSVKDGLWDRPDPDRYRLCRNILVYVRVILT